MEIRDYTLKEALDPALDWNAGGKCHNWRNHVGEHTQALWRSFSDEQKTAIAADAESVASSENWE